MFTQQEHSTFTFNFYQRSLLNFKFEIIMLIKDTIIITLSESNKWYRGSVKSETGSSLCVAGPHITKLCALCATGKPVIFHPAQDGGLSCEEVLISRCNTTSGYF